MIIYSQCIFCHFKVFMIGTFYFNKSMHKINFVSVFIYQIFELNCEIQYSLTEF